MKIGVVGSGYVGLVAGACLAENGNDVLCVDKDPAKVRALQRGRIPIYEPGLEELVRRNKVEKRLTFTTDPSNCVRNAQTVFIAASTPPAQYAAADLCKYAATAMLATRRAFMNEVANVCEIVGADVDLVRRAVASDRRIGPAFLFPGGGYGGSCFPKDVKAMVQFAAAKNYDFEILKAVESVNERQKVRLLAKMKQQLGSLAGKRIAVWGLAFKPKTDDMREAPSVPLITALLDAGATVTA